MRIARMLFIAPALLLALPLVYGQESQTGADTKKASDAEKVRAREGSNELTGGTPLKVQIVISEFNGTQKISSLPYSFNTVGTLVNNRKQTHLRFGVRVPVATGSNTFTYEDVGTRIDATVYERGDGTYLLDLTMSRSSITMPTKGTDWKPGDTSPSTEPLIRSFSDDFNLVAKLGETIEGTSAVDPVTGDIVKVEVTLNLAK